MASFRPDLERLPDRDNPSGGHVDAGHALSYHILHPDEQMAFRLESEATAHIAHGRLEIRGLLHPVDAHFFANGDEHVVHLSPGDSSIPVGDAEEVDFTDLNEETGHIPTVTLEDDDLPIATYGIPLHEVQEWVHHALEDAERRAHAGKHAHADHGAGHGGKPHGEHTGDHAHGPDAHKKDHKHDDHDHKHDHKEEDHDHDHDHKRDHKDDVQGETNPQTESGRLEAEGLFRHGHRSVRPSKDGHQEVQGAEHPAPAGQAATEPPAREVAPPPRLVQDVMNVDDDKDALLWGVQIDGNSATQAAPPAPVQNIVDPQETADTDSPIKTISAIGIATGVAGHALTPKGRSFWRRAIRPGSWFSRR